MALTSMANLRAAQDDAVGAALLHEPGCDRLVERTAVVGDDALERESC
jgi:hypothetical protein